MLITKLELKGYKRLLLNNIDLFVYTPESRYQLILGTNGSGKSSVLMELSPLPAHHSNYTKTGYKIVHLSHEGSTYVLSSIFRTGKHSFIVNGGEELNPGGTGEVQKRLCETHFEYTKEIHDIMTGEIQLTSMSTAERRKWISTLSTNDYSYALGTHKRLATAARDHQGAAKLLKGRLTHEHSKLAGLGSIEGLEERAHSLREELNLLLSSRTPGYSNLADVESQLRATQARIERVAKQVVQASEELRGTRMAFGSQEQMEQAVQRVNIEVAEQSALVKRLNTEYVELETTVHGFTTSDGITPENIDGHIEALQLDLQQRSTTNDVFGIIENPVAAANASRGVVPLASSVFTRLPDNTDRRFSRASVEERRNRLSVIESDWERLDREIRRTNHRMEHIRLAKGSQCPSCSFQWKDGVHPGEILQLETAHAEYVAAQNGMESERDTLRKFLESAEEAAGMYRSFNSITNENPLLNQLWGYIAGERLHLENPAGNVGVFHQWLTEVTRQAECTQLEARLQSLTELQLQWQRSGGVGHLGQRMATVLREVESSTASLYRLREQHSALEQYSRRALSMLENVRGLGELQRQLTGQYDKVVDAIRTREIDNVTSLHQNELASVQHRLTEHRTVVDIVRDLESSFDHTSQKQKYLAMLADALSPTEGIIAEQLSGFIGCLVAQINSVIRSIWTYDLEVLPCGMESGELDYRFPINAPFLDKPIIDVAKGSKAQQQVVNMAFQLTVMLYKGLTNYPLYLDEPGEGFDEQHRTNLMTFIKSLMDSGHHSQLFMISHYASNHGMFTQADVTVLDSSNIAVAGKYNQHVVMG